MMSSGNTSHGQGNNLNQMVHFSGEQHPIAPPIFANQQFTPAFTIHNNECRPPAMAHNHPPLTIYNTIINRSRSHRPHFPSPPPSYRGREHSPSLRILEYPSDSHRYERSRSRSRSRSRTRWYIRSTPSSVYEPSSRRVRTTEAYSGRESRRHRRSRRHDDDDDDDDGDDDDDDDDYY